ncbi:hypothetical protein ABT104_06260 [Streptomyces mobaraensis]|uniref:hypothetical protein n=1 Tax=Streptomyces mobaraensis TaxID=35621 RepID=UPI0033174549
MGAIFPLVDKGPLLDADHDAVRIAEALRTSPHPLTAAAEPSDDIGAPSTADDQEQEQESAPAADVAYAADRLLNSAASDTDRNLAGLLSS